MSNACPCIDCPLATWRTAKTIHKTPLGSLHEAFKGLVSDPAATTSLHSVMHYSSPTPPPTPASASASIKCSPTGEPATPKNTISVGTGEGPTTPSPCLGAGLLDDAATPKAIQRTRGLSSMEMDEGVPEAAQGVLSTSDEHAGIDDEEEDDEGSDEEDEEEYESDGYGVQIMVTVIQRTRRTRAARPLPPDLYRGYGQAGTAVGRGKAKRREEERDPG
ncbi:hypothetical protein D9613_000111 [Agrocybe pediades]|uniref:Uncharacterized protein n=1 Tax=Agrocybe pediades TaxID=84607 RepID=A0A8H4QZG3_9AGAR|nr:hypothetical protein D9613_000111 [Agrocybe pediades]